MEVGPTTHYIMGGIRVDADTQESTIPGLFAAGECAAGINGANRLGGNSLSDLIVFGKRAGEYAAAHARERADAPTLDDGGDRRGDEGARWRRSTAAPPARIPYKVQQDLQDTMQDLVGIVRSEAEMQEALTRLEALNARADARGRRRPSRVPHRAGTRASTCAICSRSPRPSRARRSSARRAAAATSATTIPDKVRRVRHVQRRGARDAGRRDARSSRRPIPAMPAELKQVIEEQKQ